MFIPLGSVLLTVQFVQYLGNLGRDLLRPRYGDAGHSDGRSDAGALRPASRAGRLAAPAAFFASVAIGILLLKLSLYAGLLILFFVLLFSGMPVAFALGSFGVIQLLLLFGGARMLIQVPVMAYSALDSPIVVALPLFVLTSCVLKNGQVGGKIYRFADVLVRHLPGGLGIASVIFCCLFAAMTGSSVAVAATVSLIALPEMLSRGYSRKFVIGLLAAGGPSASFFLRVCH